jgi:membrane dipeptidase
MRTVKLFVLVAAVVLITGYVLFRLIAPSVVDRKMNTIVLDPPYKVSEAASDFYSDLDFVADLHCDALLWDRDLTDGHSYGHVDFPRMRVANMALQAFTIVTKTPKNMNFEANGSDTDNITLLSLAQGRPVLSLLKRALVQAGYLHSLASNPNESFRVIESRADLTKFVEDREHTKSLSAGFLGIEGAHALEGELANVDRLFEAGVRMIGPVHFFDNELGGSAHGIKKGGLTVFGQKALKRMEELGIIIDLSHAAPALIDDILAMATRPLIVSHTGVKGTCDNVRNLSDEHLKKIAKGGGLVGIAMFEQAVCGSDALATARAIKYTADLIGVEHVALGSDFDGAVKTHFDVTGLPLIVHELIDLGMSKEDIALVMGGNVKQFLLKNLPVE